MQQIMLCADDFGIESGVDEAIVELARHHRLSATSCLTMAPGFALRASWLKDLPIDLGLHLNFTESLGDQGLYMPLQRLIMQAYSRRLAPEVIRRQIEQQLDSFEEQLGQCARPCIAQPGHRARVALLKYAYQLGTDHRELMNM